MYSAVLGHSVLKMSIRSRWLIVLFKFSVFIDFFFQRGLLLSVDERGVLNSPTIICVGFSPFNSVIFCLFYLQALSLEAMIDNRRP